MTLYYDRARLISLALMLVYVCMWQKHFDVHITLVFVLVPITNLGYSLFCRTHSLEGMLLTNVLTNLSKQ